MTLFCAHCGEEFEEFDQMRKMLEMNHSDSDFRVTSVICRCGKRTSLEKQKSLQHSPVTESTVEDYL